MSKVFLDGDLIETGSVSQPLLSRGFAFGYGVFETMKFLGGAPCFFEEHLLRLKRGVEGAGLDIALDVAALRAQACQLFQAEGVLDGVFKIVISDAGDSPKLAMFVRNKGLGAEPQPGRLRLSAVVKASQAFTSRHKSLNYMESVLELEKAKAAGFDECVFQNEFGKLTECSVANLFFVRDGVLNTPALQCGLLDGIVRRKIIEIARGMGLAVEEGEFTPDDLLAASECFLTSSGGGPRSVNSFEAKGGASATFSVGLLPELRTAYLNLERKEALANHV